MGSDHKEATVSKDFIMMTDLTHCTRQTQRERLKDSHTDLPVEMTPPPFGGSTENSTLQVVILCKRFYNLR